MDSFPQSTRCLLLRARRSAPARSKVPCRPGPWGAGRPTFRLLSCGREWDLSGLQAILPVPLLCSSTPVEPTCPRHIGHIDAAPATHTTKASTIAISGLTHAALAPAVLRFAFRVATHAQGWLPADWLTFAGRMSNPLDRIERFQLVLTFIPLSCSPDANGLSSALNPGYAVASNRSRARAILPWFWMAHAPSAETGFKRSRPSGVNS
jgi:hypothetical protein